MDDKNRKSEMVKSVVVSAVHRQPSEDWIRYLPLPAIIVDDSNGKIEIKKEGVEVIDYKKEKVWEKFYYSSACKNFGLWLAYKRGYDVIMVLDSDCVAPIDFKEKHLNALIKTGYGWENPLKSIGWFPRGYPYSQRNKKVGVNMGLWTNVLDINGADRIKRKSLVKFDRKKTKIAVGKIPFSGMNVAIRRDLIPGMFFLPNFEYKELKFRRHDDIWGGYILQKLMEKKGDVVDYGPPIVFHEGEVNAEEDAKEEEAENFYSDSFYSLVDEMMKDIQFGSYQEMFGQFADKCDLLKGTVFEPLISSIKWWKEIYA